MALSHVYLSGRGKISKTFWNDTSIAENDWLSFSTPSGLVVYYSARSTQMQRSVLHMRGTLCIFPWNCMPGNSRNAVESFGTVSSANSI